MGHGSYRASDWSKLKQSRKIESHTSETEIFKKRSIDPRFDPKYIGIREALDSDDHPNSTPIIIGLDVTGSMGYLSQKIATEALHETMMKLYSTSAVEDPALMFAAYGDYNDAAPIQVTQFESDIRVAEQLMDLWLENGGQGQVIPSMLWHFAAKHTKLDSYDKRNKKGFIFTIGDDANCRQIVSDINIKYDRVFGEPPCSPTNEGILNEAKQKFDVFHIFIDRKSVQFASLLPGRTMIVPKGNIDVLPEIIISAIQLANGVKEADILSQWSDLAKPIVSNALSTLAAGNTERGIMF